MTGSTIDKTHFKKGTIMHAKALFTVLATTLAAAPAFALDLGGVTTSHSVTTSLVSPVASLVGSSTGSVQTSSLPVPALGLPSVAPLGAVTDGNLLGNLSGVTSVVGGATGSSILGGALPGVGTLPSIGNLSGSLSAVSSITGFGGVSMPSIDLPMVAALPIPALPSLPTTGMNVSGTVDAALSGLSVPSLPSIPMPAVGLPSLNTGGIGTVTNLVGNVSAVSSLDPAGIVTAASILGSLTGNGSVGVPSLPGLPSLPDPSTLTSTVSAALPAVQAAVPTANVSSSVGGSMDMPSLPSFSGNLPQLAAPIGKVGITSNANAAISGSPSVSGDFASSL
jgi:hypothetical protein